MRRADAMTRSVAQRALVVILGFGLYAAVCASTPADPVSVGIPQAQLTSSRGAWMASGCQSCHSIYGLGGHIGPDLTNVISRSSPEYVRAMVKAGPPGMPSYGHLDESSVESIVSYLSAVDRSGTYPPRSLRSPVFGAHE